MEWIIIAGLIVIVLLMLVLIIENKKKLNTVIDNLAAQQSKEVLQDQRDISMKTQGVVETLAKNMLHLQHQVSDLRTQESQIAVKMQDTYTMIDDINKIMVNQKRRGNFGEFQLANIMAIYCGDNQNMYSMQYLLANGTIVDCALQCPGDKRILAIDAKFPLENYNRIMSDMTLEELLPKYQSAFRNDIKKHITDIASKYINKETQPYAIMFVPSEAIYQAIAGEYPELIEYAHKKKVLLVSPTTLLGVVFTIMTLTKDLNRAKHAKSIEKVVVSLNDDVNRLVERHEKAMKQCETLMNQLQTTNTSISKIDRLVTKVHDGYHENIEKE